MLLCEVMTKLEAATFYFQFGAHWQGSKRAGESESLPSCTVTAYLRLW